ncbi:sensor histidine kinase [Pseudochryseolinea flava]|uniref:Sensor histidine kinase n=1 Tax=Pseudochryseolinea flava TaxID=2059302 RepID=A0A364Y3Q5_9BACT|nr:histidine kinase [Pseudochryseolinea flava]RAW00818.1 sensor histidine kinase [Pseudochryseolinea flava]
MEQLYTLNQDRYAQSAPSNISFWEKVNANWFVRYKVYHILFWFLYHYAWTVVNVGDPAVVFNYILSSPKFLFYVVFQAVAVYFNLYFLIPRYLVRRRYVPYLLLLTLTIVVTASCIVMAYYLMASIKNTTLDALFGHSNFSYFFITLTLPSTLTSMFLAMSIKLTKNWIGAQQREQLLEKQKLESELKFLRSQLNPHFLFNTINSIFVLIHKNQDMASESLAKFSDLLRYQLYECNEDEILLSQELRYLENYIELERLRMDSKLVVLTIQIDPTFPYDATIAPLLLVPFIENAFKHVSTQRNEGNWIKINLSFSGERMTFTISNSVFDTTSSRAVMKNSGIGLQNVRRRLNLMYPGEHDLSIDRTAEQFDVVLTIVLHKHRAGENHEMTR